MITTTFPFQSVVSRSSPLVILLTLVCVVDCWKLPIEFSCCCFSRSSSGVVGNSRGGGGRGDSHNNRDDQLTLGTTLHSSSSVLDSNSSHPSLRENDLPDCNDWKSSIPSRDQIRRRVLKMMTEKEEDVIKLEPRQFGYRDTPFSWEELYQIIEREQNLAKLSRSVSQQKEYIIFRQEVQKSWNSIYDHILATKFGWEARLSTNDMDHNDDESKHNDESKLVENNNNSQGKWKAYAPPLWSSNTIILKLVPNDFPYYLEEGIEHWCLWKLGGVDDVNNSLVTDEEVENAKQELQSRYIKMTKNDDDNDTDKTLSFLSWRNPPHLKSLPDIDHVHILCYCRKNKTAPKANGEKLL
jgi:Protein of unknown function (DUF3605)